jgi:hypothetical protein
MGIPQQPVANSSIWLVFLYHTTKMVKMAFILCEKNERKYVNLFFRKLVLHGVHNLYSPYAKRLGLGNISCRTSSFESCVRTEVSEWERQWERRGNHLNSLALLPSLQQNQARWYNKRETTATGSAQVMREAWRFTHWNWHRAQELY